MRSQRETNNQQATSKYETLRDEMLNRRKAFEDSVADYKMSLVRAKEKKRQTQAENSAYWG